MKVNVYDIAKDNGAYLNIEFNEKLSGFDSEKSDYIFDSPVDFVGKLVNVKGVLKLTGRLKTEYTVKCYRCLKEIKCKMDMNISESFVKAERKKDDDSYTYKGDYVELDKPLKDNMYLNLPMKHVCDEACKGICPKCGSDLNEDQCECEEKSIDPRLEVLKDFFKS